jgi:SPX domain protein involved in polyphosphate accumulation
MSFRKEKKYSFPNKSLFSFVKYLSDQGIKKIHDDRIINSLYFDNNILSMHHESEEGVLPRKKIRIRWYDEENIFNKEVKISSLEGRYKFIEEKLNENNLNSIYNLSFFDQIYGYLKSKLLVTYERSYFELKSVRITIDQNIKYSKSIDHSKIVINDNLSVVEIKTSIDCSDDYIDDITNKMSDRFSKYTRGINFFKS